MDVGFRKKRKERKEETAPFDINSLRNQMLYRVPRHWFHTSMLSTCILL